MLVDDDTVVTNLAVLSYIDASHPDPPLFGKDPVETARVWQTISECDGHFRGPVGDISQPLFVTKWRVENQIAGAATECTTNLW